MPDDAAIAHVQITKGGEGILELQGNGPGRFQGAARRLELGESKALGQHDLRAVRLAGNGIANGLGIRSGDSRNAGPGGSRLRVQLQFDPRENRLVRTDRDPVNFP